MAPGNCLNGPSSHWVKTYSHLPVFNSPIHKLVVKWSQLLHHSVKYFLYCGIGLVANAVFCFLATKYTYKEDLDAELQAAVIEKKEQY
ncbi:hypothetical protein K7432_009752 [Basidiobolus ranarum]|uniref:Uncharacterized protein n=1 Tax=Basidiobolus ranarum TaxID=34480 RepID=A0ABR2VWK8_9FUNG